MRQTLILALFIALFTACSTLREPTTPGEYMTYFDTYRLEEPMDENSKPYQSDSSQTYLVFERQRKTLTLTTKNRFNKVIERSELHIIKVRRENDSVNYFIDAGNGEVFIISMMKEYNVVLYIFKDFFITISGNVYF